MELKCIKDCMLIDEETREELGICFTKDKIYEVKYINENSLDVIDDDGDFHMIYKDNDFYEEYFVVVE